VCFSIYENGIELFHCSSDLLNRPITVNFIIDLNLFNLINHTSELVS